MGIMLMTIVPFSQTKKQRNIMLTKTLNRHFKKYFEKITFDDLRANGYP